ncbi:MAG: hypothetical protein ACF8Q5_08315 [Phycisphaerales bacterium JB040]
MADRSDQRSGKPFAIVAAITLLILAAVITTVIFAQLALHRIFSAADSFQLTLDTDRALEAFITTTEPPAWPTSWDDLLTHPPSAERLTEDPADYQALVLLDFTPTLTEIASTDTQSQQFLVPADPGYLENWRDYLHDFPGLARQILDSPSDP